MDIAQVPLGRIISGSFVTITLGMHDPREPERARKGPKGPDEASFCKNHLVHNIYRLEQKMLCTIVGQRNLLSKKVTVG